MKFFLFLVATHHEEFVNDNWYLVKAKTRKQAESKLRKVDKGDILEMKQLPLRAYLK